MTGNMIQNWNFQRDGGRGFQTKKPSLGGVWIFSATTHFNISFSFRNLPKDITMKVSVNLKKKSELMSIKDKLLNKVVQLAGLRNFSEMRKEWILM